MKFKSIYILASLLIANAVVKGLYLATNSLGGDEPFSVYHSQLDVGSIISNLFTGNNPPLYELFLHYWINFFGISELSVRFPSLIFSCLTLLFIYKLGKRFFSVNVALLSSVFFIVSNYHILFSHEARVYALLGLLSVMSMYYYLMSIDDVKYKEKKRGYFILLILVNTLLIYAHYFGFFIILVQVSFIIFNKKLRLTHWKHLLIYIGVLILLYLPNSLNLLSRFLDSSSNGTWVEGPNGVTSIYNMLWSFSNAPVVTVLVIILLVFSAVKLILNRNQTEVGIPSKLIMFWFFFIFLFMFSISYVVPVFIDRYLMPASIAFIFVLAISIQYLSYKNNKIAKGVAIVFCLLFIVTVKPNLSNKRNVKETVNKINSLKGKETLVIMCPYSFVLNYSYYYDKEIFKSVDNSLNYKRIDELLREEKIYGINSISQLESYSIDFNKWKHIVFLDAAANFTQPNNNIINTLTVDYNLKSNYEFYEIFKVYEFVAK